MLVMGSCDGTDPDVKEAAKIIIKERAEKEYSEKYRTAEWMMDEIRDTLYDYLKDRMEDGIKNPEDGFVFEKWAPKYMFRDDLDPPDSVHDPWGNKFVVQFDGVDYFVFPEGFPSFSVISYGADGLPGGEGVNEDIGR